MLSSLKDLLLHDLRVVDARGTIVDIAQGGVDFASGRRPVLHIMLGGSAVFRTPAVEIAATEGDCVLVFYGDAHGMSLPSLPEMAAQSLDLWHDSTQGARAAQVGDGPASASVLSMALEMSYIAPSAYTHRAGPDIFHLPRISVDDIERRALSFDCEQLRRCCEGEGSAAFVMSLASLNLVHIVRNLRESLFRPESDIFAPLTRQIVTSVREIDDHCDQNWTVEGLAQRVGLSRSVFAEAFRNYIGMGPFAYLTSVRMRRAASLLEVHSITVCEVASRVGYDREASFARAFKRHHGCSPRQFKAGREV